MKYHVPTGFGFSPKASGFYPFGDAAALAGEGGGGDVVWMIQASASNHKPKGRFFWYAFGIYKPKVTMFAVEMWFGVGDGVECGRSTGLCPLPLGVPRCVIHNKKNVGTKFLVILKNNYKNHQNHSNNAKKQKNFQRTKHLHRD
ncbi:MAG: hypothetical protein MR647_05775 [Bacteroidales bacterium]|nr:hypothetical protein [Bacteroidales bacterium]